MIEITTICLVRHGETDWNATGRLQGSTDIPLNANGILQAEECGVFLKNYQWDVIVTSPLQRAKQTAEIIRKVINVPLVEMSEFMERSYGDAEGMTAEKRIFLFPNKLYPNQEDRASLTKRVMLGVGKVNDKFKAKKVLLVAHGAVINAILSKLSNGEIGSGKTTLINACISNIEYKQKEWQINDFNQVTHLSKYRK